MLTPTHTNITVNDRNETKYLIAFKFVSTPSPRDVNTMDFSFEASEAFFEARRAYSLNHPVPVLSFIAASRYVDKAIFDHRNKGVK